MDTGFGSHPRFLAFPNPNPDRVADDLINTNPRHEQGLFTNGLVQHSS